MNSQYNKLPEPVKGAIELIVGAILLFYVLGIGQKLFGAILIIIAILIMVCGLAHVGGIEKIKQLLQKK